MSEINKKVKCNDTYNIDPRSIVVREGFNCRENFDLDELVESIKENGILNPISVTQSKDENGNDIFLLVDGERRYRACMKAIDEGADIAMVKAIILPNLSEEELLEQQVIRNQGKPFNEYEYGKYVYKMQQKGYSIGKIAKKLGKNPGAVLYMRQVLDWPLELQELVKTDQISASEVRRVKTAHKGDIIAAAKEILKARNENKEKDRITSKDLKGKTKSLIDTQAIIKGMALFFQYYDEYTKDLQGQGLGVPPKQILEDLKKTGKTIDVYMKELLESRMANLFKKAE